MMPRRVLFNFVCLFSAFFLPWWSTAALLLLGLFLFRVFYEALPFAIVLDGLFSLGESGFWGSFPLTITFGLLFLLSFWVKERVSFFDEE